MFLPQFFFYFYVYFPDLCPTPSFFYNQYKSAYSVFTKWNDNFFSQPASSTRVKHAILNGFHVDQVALNVLQPGK